MEGALAAGGVAGNGRAGAAEPLLPGGTLPLRPASSPQQSPQHFQNGLVFDFFNPLLLGVVCSFIPR